MKFQMISAKSLAKTGRQYAALTFVFILTQLYPAQVRVPRTGIPTINENIVLHFMQQTCQVYQLQLMRNG